MWKLIQKANELKELCLNDKKGVGIVKKGDLYIFDFKKNKPVKISVQEAINILEISPDLMAEVIKSGGKLKPKPVPEPEKIEPVVEKKVIEENPIKKIEKPIATNEMIYDLLLEINRKLN